MNALSISSSHFGFNDAANVALDEGITIWVTALKLREDFGHIAHEWREPVDVQRTNSTVWKLGAFALVGAFNDDRNNFAEKFCDWRRDVHDET